MSARAASRARHRVRVADAFPYTRRPLPWILAAFLAMLFLVPIEGTELKVHLPVGSQIDRFAVVGLVLAWIIIGGDQRAFLRTPRSKMFAGAAALFVVLALGSVLFDASRLIHLGEVTLASKRYALLASFVVLAWFTLSALRFEDVRGFSTYLIGLGTVMAVGMLIERHTGYNAFYEWARVILKPVANVIPSPTNIHPELGSDGRVAVVGPTHHGLAATTMLVIVMPFALVRMFEKSSRRSWWLNTIALTLMVIAAASTQRKTALIVPVAVIAYLAIYRPRPVLKMAPIGLVALVVLVHFASPGSLGTIFTPTAGLESASTNHRATDFEDVTPDILARPLLGRGFGTLDPDQPKQFRINDDEYIDEIWQVGIVGLLAYLWMILAPILLARRAIRGEDPEAASLALAASAGCAAYLVVNALFDAMSFAQAPYMFFLIAAFATVAAAGPEGNVSSLNPRHARAALTPWTRSLGPAARTAAGGTSAAAAAGASATLAEAT